mmetsp:Transcript_40287/g.91940  ORF Transcript_40287/g.91940 Transcript_40287/m.91940 type:complete len:288 (+) Transcript_40287:31-894(+)
MLPTYRCCSEDAECGHPNARLSASRPGAALAVPVGTPLLPQPAAFEQQGWLRQPGGRRTAAWRRSAGRDGAATATGMGRAMMRSRPPPKHPVFDKYPNPLPPPLTLPPPPPPPPGEPTSRPAPARQPYPRAFSSATPPPPLSDLQRKQTWLLHPICLLPHSLAPAHKFHQHPSVPHPVREPHLHRRPRPTLGCVPRSAICSPFRTSSTKFRACSQDHASAANLQRRPPGPRGRRCPRWRSPSLQALLPPVGAQRRVRGPATTARTRGAVGGATGSVSWQVRAVPGGA